MRDVYGLEAAMLAASIISSFCDAHVRTERRQKATLRPISLNDHSPVIDTTRESKRARRRRLAKATLGTGDNHG
ncbi:hypothetical protein [Shinella sp. JR1-6]|uniref:hypothetical protein n=1 Tax=Shinella sp. JR1-6 TaxID=2527671 RepID=UPI00102D5DBA|nr:hypothetical protein [Shinella sp. JR1-6]TAA54071.1 hypothetical protein EXZ48_27550 [Shinella sp. JR1-6]